MANRSGNQHTARFFSIPAIMLLLIFLPCIAAASTPPLLPSLTFDPQLQEPAPGDDLVLSLLWERNGIPYRSAPDHLDVTFYAFPSGDRVAVFRAARSPDAGSGTESSRYYLSIPAALVPAGELTVIAGDPLSGATARKQIAIAWAIAVPEPVPSASATLDFFTVQPILPFSFR